MLLPLEHRSLWLLGSASNPPPSTAAVGPEGVPQGSAPPRTDNPCGLAMFAVRISSLLQVAVNNLCPAGPIQAVEILIQSPSLADMCRVHQAVIRRIQVQIPPPRQRGGLRLQQLPQPGWERCSELPLAERQATAACPGRCLSHLYFWGRLAGNELCLCHSIGLVLR